MSLTYNKRVINMIQQHILDCFDYEIDFVNTVNSKRKQNYVCTYFKNKYECKPPTVYNSISEMVFDGCFLAYPHEIQHFLNDVLCINPNHKEYTDQQSFDLYAHLIARDGEKLYYKLINKN